MISHIKLFRDGSSCYRSNKMKQTYLPQELNANKIHSLYSMTYPEKTVSYNKYKNFSTKFNVSFGYLRTDTCSSFNVFNTKVSSQLFHMNITTDIKEQVPLEEYVSQQKSRNILSVKGRYRSNEIN